MLSYLNNSKIESVTNETIERIHNYVSSVKESAELQNCIDEADEASLTQWIKKAAKAESIEAFADEMQKEIRSI